MNLSDVAKAEELSELEFTHPHLLIYATPTLGLNPNTDRDTNILSIKQIPIVLLPYTLTTEIDVCML